MNAFLLCLFISAVNILYLFFALFRNQILLYLLWIAVLVRLHLIRPKHLNKVLQLEPLLLPKWMAMQREVALLVRKFSCNIVRFLSKSETSSV